MSGFSFEEHSNSFIGPLFPFLFPLSIPRIFVEHIFQDLTGVLFALFNNPHLHLVRYDSTDFTWDSEKLREVPKHSYWEVFDCLGFGLCLQFPCTWILNYIITHFIHLATRGCQHCLQSPGAHHYLEKKKKSCWITTSHGLRCDSHIRSESGVYCGGA